MIFIQPIRKNDIVPEAGKQIELGKQFMNAHNWTDGEYNITLKYISLSEKDAIFNKKIINTTLKVRGSERGGDRVGVDCKEYSFSRNIGLPPLKKFFVEDLNLKEAKGFFVLEDNGDNGAAFNLYYIPDGTSFEMFYNKFKNVVDLAIDKESSLLEHYEDFPLQQIFYGAPGTGKYLPYLTALRTKPFMLLAGISGTGKSRIVREMAKACWKDGDEEYGKNNPKNFCMVQVKPNWHDSSELIGYVSRINGEKYVVGPFLRFMAKAIKDPNTPYFLCLDEMNLAPVEQYFAEYLSVIESRKLNADGSITTDPIVPYENTEAYGTLIDQLFYDDADRKEYKSETGTKRLTIPQNLFVIGTVNMDETTFSFSRKVLDRAMTIEMNEVNLSGGLTDEGSEIGYIGNCIIGNAAEGKDVYSENKDLCDKVIAYLEKVNAVLEGSPFKIAYRTRNEFLLYAVNRQLLDNDSQLWQTLDEMTSMKILSRIEGDSERTKKVLEELKKLVDNEITVNIADSENQKSISASKIKEMLDKLSSGYTSYWA